jgi:hypothetical protein
VLVATRADWAIEDITMALRIEGFSILRSTTEFEILDCIADALLGSGAQPRMLLIGTALYERVRHRLDAVLRQLEWKLPIVIQLDHPAPVLSLRHERDRMVVGAALLPLDVVGLASRQLARVQTREACGADLIAWVRGARVSDRTTDPIERALQSDVRSLSGNRFDCRSME